MRTYPDDPSWLDAPPPHGDEDAPQNRGKVKANGHDHAAEKPDSTGLLFRPIADIVAERREPEWILHHIIEQKVLALIAGPRGSFKSFIALDWAMRAAIDGHGVVILSGEGAGLDRRVDAWVKVHQPTLDLTTLHMVAMEKAVGLNLEETCQSVCTAMTALGWPIALVVIDTLSKYTPGLDENDNSANAEFLNMLSHLMRDALQCTVLLVAHSGHSTDTRPRGASALMCNPDSEYIVKRPDPTAMTVTVSRDRFKDTASLPPLAYAARIVDLGRVDSYGDQVTSLVLETTDAPPMQPRVQGKNQQAAVIALREFCRTHDGVKVISSIDMAGMLKTIGVARQRRADLVNFMVNAGFLTPCIGGHGINVDALL